MSSDRTVGQQQPPERPVPKKNTDDSEIEQEREQRRDPLSNINTEPGDRKTDNVKMLVIEAELVADGHQPDNPAKPRTEKVGKAFLERLDEHEDDLVPAWTRPWEAEE